MDNNKELLFSLINNEVIINTIITSNKQTNFVIYNRQSKKIEIKSDVEIDGITYITLKYNSNYITSGTIYLPTDIIEYGTKEILLKEVQDYIYKYLDISESYRIICSYYVLLTYIYESFSEIPYLRVTGDYGSGKSRLLKTLGNICYSPIITNGGSTLSPIFRMIDKFRGTLIIDESDIGNSSTTNETIKLFNNGYQKGNNLLRSNGKNFEPVCFNVYGPKIIGGRNEFIDKATESRCLGYAMKRTKRTDLVLSIDDSFYIESENLRNKLLKFRFDTYGNIKIKNEVIKGLEPRINQILNPILSLIDNNYDKEIIIEHVMQKQTIIKQERKESKLGIILHIIKELLDIKQNVSYNEILNGYYLVEGRKDITNRKLGSMLRENGIHGSRKNSGFIIIKDENIMNLIDYMKNTDGIFSEHMNIMNVLQILSLFSQYLDYGYNSKY